MQVKDNNWVLDLNDDLIEIKLTFIDELENLKNSVKLDVGAESKLQFGT